MALKRPKGSAGNLLVLEHDSRILRDNPLGDPYVRKVGVWLPPQYDGRKRFPVLYDLVGFTGSGPAPANWKPFSANAGPPEARPRASAARREARRPGLAQGKDDGRIKRFLQSVWKREKLSGKEGLAIMNLCMAATYDPDPRAPNGFRIPFNAESGEVIPERWRNWRRHDPINLVSKYRANLKSLRGIYIDCGWRDQYHIHYGSRLLSQRLAEAGVKHRDEEFDDDHSDVEYRMDTSLPFLYRALR